MQDKLDALNLPTKQFDRIKVHLLDIPCPPQLRRAIGYGGSAEYIGVWFDNGSVSVSDGRSNFTSSNPGWDAYWNYHLIQNYIFAIRCFGEVEVDFFGKVERHNVAEHGFLLADGQIYLASVKTITKILSFNPDRRPDWIKKVTEKDLLDPSWQEKYHAYSSSRLFPKHNIDCLQATRQMLCWLNGNL